MPTVRREAGVVVRWLRCSVCQCFKLPSCGVGAECGKQGCAGRLVVAERQKPAVADLSTAIASAPNGVAIAAECDAIKAMLLAKNAAYGNSALEPVRVFSRASAEEQLLVRIDDKISRIQRGSAAGEDVIADLIGYLVLLRVQRKAVQS